MIWLAENWGFISTTIAAVLGYVTGNKLPPNRRN